MQIPLLTKIFLVPPPRRAKQTIYDGYCMRFNTRRRHPRKKICAGSLARPVRLSWNNRFSEEILDTHRDLLSAFQDWQWVRSQIERRYENPQFCAKAA